MKQPNHWIENAIIYHIYPLGLCGAPSHNDFSSTPVPRLEKIIPWLDHIQALGANTIYLGPLFESSAHGYDTADYFHLDRRLGNDETLRNICNEIHRRGMRVIFDGVFNHTGRHFWAFRDLLEKRQNSAFCDWFYKVEFNHSNQYSDPFWYEGWSGHEDLVKLNLLNPQVRQHLFQAIQSWITEFGIDGLRLDAADVLDMGFIKELSVFCRSLKPGFWLLGEIVHGDYRRLANDEMLDSVTNYECYKGLYSSLNDLNYFEIAYALNRQNGTGGIYPNLVLYNFVDNHDVNRVASNLVKREHLYPLYILLFCMPGVPGIYYGSEWGLEGKRTGHSDAPLRPPLDLEEITQSNSNAELEEFITRLAGIRRTCRALRNGDYTQLLVNHEQLVFCRKSGKEIVVVALNSSSQPSDVDITAPPGISKLVDLLNPGVGFDVRDGKVHIEMKKPCWGCVLQGVS